MIMTVTGHRPDKLGGWRTPNPVYNSIIDAIDKMMTRFKPDLVITGMALGFDQWVAEVCIDMNVPFAAAIPHDGHDSRWPAAAKAKYRWLLDKAHQVVQVSEGPFTAQKMWARNRYMVDNCDMVAAAWNGGDDGGTAGTVAYAYELLKPVFFVPCIPSAVPIVTPEIIPLVDLPTAQRGQEQIQQAVDNFRYGRAISLDQD